MGQNLCKQKINSDKTPRRRMRSSEFSVPICYFPWETFDITDHAKKFSLECCNRSKAVQAKAIHLMTDKFVIIGHAL